MNEQAAGREIVSVHAASRLAPGLLALLLEVEPENGAPSEWPVTAGQNCDTIELDARWLACSAAGEQNRWLVTIALPPHARAPLPPIRVGRGVLAADAIELKRGTAIALAKACGDWLDVGGRMRATGFLADAARSHAIEQSPELSETLLEIRDVLRPALPTSRVAPGVDMIRLENVVRADEFGFWLTGYLHTGEPQRAGFTAVAPEGARAMPLDGAVTFHPRPDLDPVFGEYVEMRTLGFTAYVELVSPSHHPTGWLVELRTAGGAVMQDAARKPVLTGLGEVRRLMRHERSETVTEDSMANQLLPAATRLAGGVEAGVIKEIVDYGHVLEAPDVSIVVAAGAIDRIEHQLVEFARDPEIEEVELIYVIAEDDRELASTAEGLSSLYRRPFRVVRISPMALRSRALNLGASVARGRLLVLMAGDTLATTPGWLGAMRDLIDSSPDIGVVGPKLLHADGSIADAGGSFVRGRDRVVWKRASPLRGLAPTIGAATETRTVDGVSEACLMVEAERFNEVGGLCELYLEKGDEAGDLCLALAATGARTWYLSAAQLHVLETDSWLAWPTSTTVRFNGWLLGRRWERQLGECSSDPDDGELVGTQVPIPSWSPSPVGNQPGSRVELLDVVPAKLDGTSILDGRLSAPPTGPKSPFEHTYALVVEGWVLMRNGGPATVEVRGGSIEVATMVADLQARNVGGLYPDLPGTDACGFQFVLSSLALALEFELEVNVVAADGTRVPLGRIRGRRRPLLTSYQPAFQPLLITTLGRSGSIWLLQLLAQHPEIGAFRPFSYEGVIADYWMGVLHALARPSSYFQSVRPHRHHRQQWWLGEYRPQPLPLRVPEPEFVRWLGRENIETFAAFCQSRFDAFYDQLTRTDGSQRPRYIAEKCEPGNGPRTISELYPESREIVLVRDFRDMVCSIFDYNAKRQFEMWGRDEVGTDAEWFGFHRTQASRLLNAWQERAERAYLLRYEDLVADPETRLGSLLGYLGLQATAADIKRMVQGAARARPQDQAFHRTSQSVGTSVGRWRDELSPEHKALSAEAFDDLLKEFGYESG